MTRADNSAYLRLAAKERHEAALERSVTALRSLDRAGLSITFNSVAERAAVSRSWLYRQPELREAIVRCRSFKRKPGPAVPAAQRSSFASLQSRLDTAHAEITRLRAENSELRHQVERLLGERRMRS
ncbi:MAG TPA: DUF6262 family protein [Acidimicrobiales bacterium]|nr:DUF6262 family protein [Acidimicrobiales bacterium]